MANFCIYCGAALQDGMAFCTQCGKLVQAAAQPMQPAVQPAPKMGMSTGAKVGIIAAACVLGVGTGVALAILQPWAQGDRGASSQESSTALVQGETSEAVQTEQQVTPKQETQDTRDEQGTQEATTSAVEQERKQAEQAPEPRLSAPNISGMSEDDAKALIADAGLVVGAVIYENSTDVAKGNVISQNPSAGTEMDAGTSVGFVVSAGKAEHRYEIIYESYTWDEARASAEERGGYLACITSDNEWEQVLGMLPSEGVSVLWVGAAAGTSHNFVWVSGEEFSFSKWASGEPNNDGGNEDKLCLLRSNGVWGWYDVPNNISSVYSSDKMGFIVEYEN